MTVSALTRPFARLSVRARTTLLAAAIVLAALVGGAVLLSETLDGALERERDRAVIARARDVAVLAEQDALPGKLSVTPDEDFVQVVTADGAVVAGTAGRPQRPPAAGFAPADGGPEVRRVNHIRDGSEFEDYRVAAVQVEAPRGPVTVYAGYAVEAITESQRAVRAALRRGIPLLVLVLLVGTWLIVGRALRPVSDIRRKVDDISLHALDHRVPEPSSHDEIRALAVTMNAMLDRLEGASNRQRDFVADASHELQNPIAALRAQLEVSIAHPDATDWPTTARWLLEDTERMERLVRDLLYLARVDSDQGIVDGGQELDLDDIVLEEASRLRTRLSAVTLDTSQVSAAPVAGSPDAFTRLVRNLLENAARYAASRVDVELSATADRGVRFVVSDDGRGVRPEDRERIFERFIRLEPDRGRRDGGTGLGLSICREIVRRQGGTLAFVDVPRGARIVVEWSTGPQRPDAQQHADHPLRQAADD
ncbi:MAG: sensor histidine kinase [Nocardioidaceae bacterium]